MSREILCVTVFNISTISLCDFRKLKIILVFFEDFHIFKRMTIEIEKGIPIPEKKNRGEFTAILKQMQSGDSFEAPAKKRTTIVSAANYSGIKITTKAVGDDKIRIWRVS